MRDGAELKAAQSQLLLQENLAALGRLTAGLAHELNNPVNFADVALQDTPHFRLYSDFVADPAAFVAEVLPDPG